MEFFSDNITKIRVNLDAAAPLHLAPEVNQVCPYTFDEFNMVTVDDVRECVVKLSSKSCELDPLPGYVTRNAPDTLATIYDSDLLRLKILSSYVPEWLASSGGTKCLKPIEEMSKEELNVFLKRFCTSARKKRWHTQFTKVHQKNPLDCSFARCRSTNHFFAYL